MTDPSARLDDIEARATFWHERAKQLNRELGAAECQLRAALAREQAVRGLAQEYAAAIEPDGTTSFMPVRYAAAEILTALDTDTKETT